MKGFTMSEENKDKDNNNKRRKLWEILMSPEGIQGLIVMFLGLVIYFLSGVFSWNIIVTIIGVVICVSGANSIMNIIRDIDSK